MGSPLSLIRDGHFNGEKKVEATENKLNCYNCGKDLAMEPSTKISRSEECPHCYASLHCCKMCRFFDKSAYNECKEPMANRVLDKEKANFCDFFKLDGGGSQEQDKEDLLAAAKSLFKD